MPIYEHDDFYREVEDVPDELLPLVPLVNHRAQAGCLCDECSTVSQFTPEQVQTVRDIVAQQRQAQRDLEAHQHRASGRCGRCGSGNRGSVEDVDTAEGPYGLCYWCRSAMHLCEQCDRLTARPRALHGTVIWCQGCTVSSGLAECWCGLLYDPYSSRQCTMPRGTIHSYSYRPTPQFLTLGDGSDVRLESKRGTERDLTPYMGFELEVSFAGSDLGRDDAANTVTDIIDEVAYLKEDGSIDCGFELVTHPMTLHYAIERFPWRVLDAMDEAGGEVHDGLGLHIHVSKAAFESPSHEYRWLLFWHRNYRVMRRLARRDSAEWAPWTPDARQAAKRIAKKETTGREFGRYQAINTTNEHTYEVRIFGATLDRSEIIADLALVSGTVEYCRELDANGVLKASGWDFATFAKWLTKRSVYGALSADIAQHFPHGFSGAQPTPGPRPVTVPRNPRRRATPPSDEFDAYQIRLATATSNFRLYQSETFTIREESY